MQLCAVSSTRNGAVTDAVPSALRVDRPTLAGDWRERPALALLAGNAGSRSNIIRLHPQGFFLICRKADGQKTSKQTRLPRGSSIRGFGMWSNIQVKAFPVVKVFCVRGASRRRGR